MYITVLAAVRYDDLHDTQRTPDGIELRNHGACTARSGASPEGDAPDVERASAPLAHVIWRKRDDEHLLPRTHPCLISPKALSGW